jgi:hypothetical protein
MTDLDPVTLYVGVSALASAWAALSLLTWWMFQDGVL